MFHKTIALLGFALAGQICAFSAENLLPFVSPMFSDNMVLQRGKPNPMWGWSTPGQEVRVQIGDETARATVAPDGRWQVRLQPPPAGGPYTVKIDGPQHAELHEILVGDVWLCGGQSNMELPVSRTRNGEQVIRSANNPEIRFYKVGSHAAYGPAEVPKGQWKI